ncbi:MAG: ankyrin repeat domain-containing protein [Actinomycetota bacterium]
MTELVDAVKAGDRARVESLLSQYPMLASRPAGDGLSPLLHAVYRSRHDLVDLLLAAGVELSVFEAAALGDGPRLAALLDHESSLVEARSPDGFTPLHLASFFGRPDAVRLLLARGADPRVISSNDVAVTALNSAAAANHYDISVLLLGAGAEADARMEGGWTPLMAAADNGDGRMVRLLLDHAADARARADDGRAPIDLARAREHGEVVAMLSEAEPS